MIGIDSCPACLAFDDTYGLVAGKLLELLHVAARPANLQPLDLCAGAQAKVLFVGEAPEATPP